MFDEIDIQTVRLVPVDADGWVRLGHDVAGQRTTLTIWTPDPGAATQAPSLPHAHPGMTQFRDHIEQTLHLVDPDATVTLAHGDSEWGIDITTTASDIASRLHPEPDTIERRAGDVTGDSVAPTTYEFQTRLDIALPWALSTQLALANRITGRSQTWQTTLETATATAPVDAWQTAPLRLTAVRNIPISADGRAPADHRLAGQRVLAVPLDTTAIRSAASSAHHRLPPGDHPTVDQQRRTVVRVLATLDPAATATLAHEDDQWQLYVTTNRERVARTLPATWSLHHPPTGVRLRPYYLLKLPLTTAVDWAHHVRRPSGSPSRPPATPTRQATLHETGRPEAPLPQWCNETKTATASPSPSSEHVPPPEEGN